MTTPSVGRWHARRLVPELGPCEECGGPARDRHHIDGNPHNNVRENIVVLCRSCHMKVDGRGQRLGHRLRTISPPKPCVECGKPSKPTRKGLCGTCYLRKWWAKSPKSVCPSCGGSRASGAERCWECARGGGK